MWREPAEPRTRLPSGHVHGINPAYSLRRSQENGSGYDRWQAGDAHSQQGYDARGGSSYAQRVSRMRAGTGSEGRREHLRWEDEEASYDDEVLPERPRPGRRYGRR